MVASSINILSYSYNFSFFTIFPKLLAGESTADEIDFRSPYSDISVSLKGGDRISLVTSGGKFNNLHFEYFDPHNRFLYISDQSGYKVKYSSISVNEIRAIVINDISPNNGGLGVLSILGGVGIGSASGMVIDLSAAIANSCNGNPSRTYPFGVVTSIGAVMGGVSAFNMSKHHFEKKIGQSIEIPLVGEGKWEIVEVETLEN